MTFSTRTLTSLALITMVCSFGASTCRAQVSVLTQHNNTARTGSNDQETTLNTSNVNVANFGKLFSRTVDGFIYAQPLYVPSLNIAGKTRNVVFVATEHNSVYAFDADDPTATTPLWYVGPSTLGTPVPNSDICAVYPPCPYTDLQPEIGITSTPVIDLTTNTIYVVNRMKDGSGTDHFQLWALDLLTGASKFGSPAELAATVGGVTFDPFQHLQRPGLLLLNGVLYIGFGSEGDFGTWYGWIMAYDASTLSQLHVYNAAPGGKGGSFWAGGAGLIADQSNAYAISSNGSFNGTGGQSSVPTECSSCILKFDSSLNPIAYYTPSNQSFLNNQNQDLGSGGGVLIPNTTLLVTAGKDGYVRLVDTTSLGGYNATLDTSLQSFHATPADVMGGLTFWNNMLYLWGPGDFQAGTPDYLKAWKFVTATNLFDIGSDPSNPQPASESTIPSAIGEGNTAALSVSATGTQAGTGIVWANAASQNAGDATQGTVAGTLYAFDASDLTHELWDSNQDPARDSLGNYAKFCPPTIANGKVYMATFSKQLVVYGLNPPAVTGAGFVQVAAATPQTSTNSVTVTYSSPETKGDLNVVVVGWSDSTSTVSSITDSQGNTYQRAVGPTVGQSLTQSIYYAITKATGSNTVTVTFNQSASFPDVRVLEYTGIDAVSPLDAVAAAIGSTGTTTDSGPATTSFASELIFGANTVAGQTSAPGPGFTSRIITSPDADIAEDKVVSSVGSYNATATLAANSAWVMQMATFKVASAPPPAGDFSLTASGPQTVNAGTSAQYTLTVTPQNSFTSAVNFSIACPANVLITCSITPNPITPAGGPVTATLKITTTAATAALRAPRNQQLLPLYATFLPLPGIALLGAGFAGSWRRKFGTGAAIVLLLLVLLLGCGGGGTSSGGGGGGGGNPGTPAGTYNITATATSGSLSHQATVALSVQ